MRTFVIRLFILLGLVFPAIASAVIIPKFAYVTNLNSNTISVYTIDPSTGALTAGTAVATGLQPRSVTVDPTGKFVYVANGLSNNLSVYTIDQITGALSAGTAVVTGANPYSVTVDPSGRFAYVANQGSNTVSVYTIDPITGALTAGTAVASGYWPSSVTVDPSGRFAYVANSHSGSNSISVYTINQTTGALSAGIAAPTGISPSSLTVDPTGKFVYVTNSGDNTITAFTINQSTGVLSAGAPVATGIGPSSVTVDPTGKFAYVANAVSSTVSVYTINPANGALTSGTPIYAGGIPYSITVDPSGKFAYVTSGNFNSVGYYTINPTTGMLTAGTLMAPAGIYPYSVATSGRVMTLSGSPTIASITAGNGQATVNFTAPLSNGGSAITSYTVTASPGGLTATGAASPLTVTGLTNGTAYTFSVTATNIIGTSVSSISSSAITPVKISQTVNFGVAPTVVANGIGVISATATSGLAASLTSLTPSICSVAGSTVNGIAAGICTIAANQSGDANYNAAGQVTQSFSVIAGRYIPKFAYVTNVSSNTVSAYTINPGTGVLTAGTTVSAGTSPNSVVVDPSGRFAYVANYASNNVSVYTINATTGALTAGTTVTAGLAPSSVAVDPFGRFAYVVGAQTISAYTINPTTGALTAATTLTRGVLLTTPASYPVLYPNSIAVDPSGRFVYVTNVSNNTSTFSVYMIDQTTGALTAGAAVTGNAASVVVDPYGRHVYFPSNVSTAVSVYTINPTTGALTMGSVSSTSLLSTAFPESLSIDPTGKFAYITTTNLIHLYAIDQTTGALLSGSSIFSSNPNNNAAIVTVDSAGKFAYVANHAGGISTYAINPGNGTLTANGAAVNSGLMQTSVTTVAGIITAPSVPSTVTTSAGVAQATVSFTAPASDGGSIISAYTVIASPGGLTATGAASPLTVTGLTNGTAYTFTVTATNFAGTSAASVASNPVMPVKASQTVSFGIAPAPLAGGTGVVSATATSGLAVSFTSITPSICTVAGSTVTGVSAGVCTIAADQAGNANYNAAPQVTQSISIGKGNQVITSFAFPPIAIGGTGSISALATSGLAVSFGSLTPSICSVAGSTITGITAGSCTIAANQSGNANYNAAPQATQLVPISTAFNLSPSWNLLGNGVNAPFTVATTFGNAANVATVWKWVPAASKWAFYTPTLTDGGAAYAASKGYDFLTVINGGEGFWVNAKAAFTAPLPAGTAILSGSFQVQSNPALNKLLAGWNLIGTGDSLTPSAFNQSLSVTPPAIGTIPANVTTLWGWDSTLVNWYFYAPSLDSAGTLASYITSKNYLNFGTKILDPAMGFWVNIPGVVATGGGVPTVTGITPTTGAAGATVTITGTNFNSTPANNTVKFSGVLATVTAATSTSLTVTVPTGAITGTVSVTTAGGTATSAGGFTGSTISGGGTSTVAGLMGGAIQNGPLNLTTTVSTIAGNATYPLLALSPINGIGAAAIFDFPEGVTTDGTNLYVSEQGGRFLTIRKISIATGAVTTLIQSIPSNPFRPFGITTDGTNVYVGDTGYNVIRKVAIATGIMTTLAGSGVIGSADGIGTAASFNNPIGITCDGTNLYVADRYNEKIRKIVIATGAVTTLAGSGAFTSTGAIPVDGISTLAAFSNPANLTTDGTNLYVLDGDAFIRKVEIATGVVTTLSTGGVATFNFPTGITTDGTNLYVSDNLNHMIRKVNIATGAVTLVAGHIPTFADCSASTVGCNIDGVGATALISDPVGIITDGVSLYFVQSLNNIVRKIQ